MTTATDLLALASRAQQAARVPLPRFTGTLRDLRAKLATLPRATKTPTPTDEERQSPPLADARVA